MDSNVFYLSLPFHSHSHTSVVLQFTIWETFCKIVFWNIINKWLNIIANGWFDVGPTYVHNPAIPANANTMPTRLATSNNALHGSTYVGPAWFKSSNHFSFLRKNLMILVLCYSSVLFILILAHTLKFLHRWFAAIPCGINSVSIHHSPLRNTDACIYMDLIMI